METHLISKRYMDNGESCISLNSVQIKAKQEVLEKLKNGHYESEKVACVVCGRENFTRLAEKDRYGIPLSVVACRNCGLLQSNPRMTAQSYSEFYELEYRRLYVGESSPSEEFYDIQLRQGRRIIEFLKDSGYASFEDTRVLEVGCGAGGILGALREKGATVKGCDLGSEYLQFGVDNHNLDLEHGPIDSISTEDKYDLIVYSHVFEHLTDPVAELKKIGQRLSEGGILYIEVPGVHHIRDSYGSDFLRLLQNAHVYHFTLTSLNNLLSSNKFQLLVGNEYVRALYRPQEIKPHNCINEYPVILNNLKRYEQIRPINRYLPRNLLRVLKLNYRELLERVRDARRS